MFFSHYVKDMHGVGDSPPILDQRQDWQLLSAFENATHTSLRFKRSLDSCDPEDVAITVRNHSVLSYRVS